MFSYNGRMSLSEKLSLGEHSIKKGVSSRPENLSPDLNPSQISGSPEIIERALSASFIGEKVGRQMARVYVNGGPDHLLTVNWQKGIMGESLHVYATGEKGPTVITLADYKGPRGESEHKVEAVYLKGIRGESEGDVLDAIAHIEEIFPSYTQIQELFVDPKGERFVNGVRVEDGSSVESPLAKVDAVTELVSGEPSVIGQ